MKTSILTLSILLMVSACTDDGNLLPNADPTPKLLMAIREDGDKVVDFRYDALNRLIGMSRYHADTVSYTETYEYDANSRMIRRLYGDFEDGFTYSSDGNLLSARTIYEPTNREWVVEYQNKNGRISSGTTFFNGAETGSIEFSYDSNGNTTERTQYGLTEEGEKYIVSQFKMEYDRKINPVRDLSIYPVDVFQRNNPTYFYHYEVVMSMPPLEFSTSYEYCPLGLPSREFRGTTIFTYEYIDRIDKTE